MLCALGACSPLDGTNLEATAFRPSESPVTIDTVTRNDRLSALARSQHPRILGTYGGEYSDPKLERMVAKVVGNLTFTPDNPNQTFRITILNSPNVNAFALPGGYLYVTRGLLALANDSAEVAAVLAHEMGHVTANHGLERQKKEAEEELASKVATDLLSQSADARAALIRNKLSLAQFSRNQELEADAIGIRSLGRTGYDPYAASRFLRSMGDYTELRSVSGATDASLDFLASHPSTPQRVELAQNHARAFGPPGTTGRRDRDSFLAGIDGMLFGDTPDEGYVRGTTFMHPGLGIAFSVPEGFVIDNSAAAVTATGPGDMAVRFDAVALEGNMSLADYVKSGWVSGLDPASVQETTIHGLPAAIARAQAQGWDFDIAVVKVGTRIFRLLTAAPRGSAALAGVARTVSDSFHVLGNAEKAALKPLRIRIVTARPGDTVASLAASMIGVGRKTELFRVLNELGPGATISAGDKVKIVTDR